MFLYRYTLWCSKFFFISFQKSLSESHVPARSKCAKLVPIPMSGCENMGSNYRPISLLSARLKMLEHIISTHICEFLEGNNVFSTLQHGFRGGLPTTTQLVETVHDFESVLDFRKQIDAIFLDFAKAFDKVPHNKLLTKTRSVLVNDTISGWLA